MSDDGSEKPTATWPLPKFYFEVSWDSMSMSFQEVTGLDAETDSIEYRHGNSPVFAHTKMPGIKKLQNVIMKKGVFQNDNKFWDWFNRIKMNTIERKTITIKLLDEAGKPAMVWTLKNAFPVKVTGTDLKADGNEVAIESLEVAYEELSVSNT